MARVKICGVSRPEHALAAAQAGADFVGLVFAASPRQVTAAQAREIVAALGAGPLLLSDPLLGLAGREEAGVAWFHLAAQAVERLLARKRPLVVGVFADAPAAEINAMVEEAGLDMVQLSGDEPWEICLALNRPAIKVVKVEERAASADILAAVSAGRAALCMLETHVPGLKGGGGRAFAWPLALEVSAHLPVLVSGGLRPDNVAQAVREARPWGVDVSSGVETGGVKDANKIESFVRIAKAGAPEA